MATPNFTKIHAQLDVLKHRATLVPETLHPHVNRAVEQAIARTKINRPGLRVQSVRVLRTPNGVAVHIKATGPGARYLNQGIRVELARVIPAAKIAVSKVLTSG